MQTKVYLFTIILQINCNRAAGSEVSGATIEFYERAIQQHVIRCNISTQYHYFLQLAIQCSAYIPFVLLFVFIFDFNLCSTSYSPKFTRSTRWSFFVQLVYGRCALYTYKINQCPLPLFKLLYLWHTSYVMHISWKIRKSRHIICKKRAANTSYSIRCGFLMHCSNFYSYLLLFLRLCVKRAH